MNKKERKALQRFVAGEHFGVDILRHLVDRILDREADLSEQLNEEKEEYKKLYEEVEELKKKFLYNMDEVVQLKNQIRFMQEE